MKPIKSIVAGVDFTACSASALRQALRIASVHQADLTAVHVIDTFVVMELEEALSPIQQSIREGLVSEAAKEWAAFRRTVSGSDAVRFETAIDHRAMGLLRLTREARADLLILGAFGEHCSGVGTSTMTTACVRKAPCDVLLVRDNQTGRFERVIAAVDFSQTSAHALERAAQFAAPDGAELHVLHVFSPPWENLHYKAQTPQMAPQFVKQYRDTLTGQLRAFGHRTLESFSDLKVRYELFDLGNHRSGITEYAKVVGADLICLGTRGRSNLRDILLGSTAEKALSNAACSILAVRGDTTGA